MLFLAGLFENLPSATLGAVVIDAMVGLVTLREFRRYYGVIRADWLFFTGAGLGILCFGIMQGILVGVVLSLLLLIARSSRTNVRRLHFDPDTRTYHDVSRHEGLEPTPGILVARVDGPLFFADADRFRSSLRELAAGDDVLKGIVIDAEAVHLTDTDGADMLLQVTREWKQRGVGLALARVHPPVLALWERAGVIEAIGAGRVFARVRDAVAALGGEHD
jgi:MFS superfamily sulfate permease-like transporter